MKNKVLIILVICALGVFWDDMAMRLARVEQAVKDADKFHQRMDLVEEKAAKIKHLEERLAKAEERLVLLNDWSAKSNLTAKRLELLSGPLLREILQERGIKVFRTSQFTRSIEDVTIASDPLYQNSHWGRHSFVSVGARGSQNVRRALINFKTLTPGLLKGKRILAAVLYLKQVNVESLSECGETTNETINVFAVRKVWTQDANMEGNVLKGDASWISARAGQENWSAPGCGRENDDFDPVMVATSGPVVSSGAREWVPFVFTPEGLWKLKVMLQENAPANYGFILKLANENDSNAFLSFNSSERANANNRPYMEIYYVDEPATAAAKN